MENKRIFIAIGFGLAIIGIGYALYYVFFRPTPEQPIVTPPTEQVQTPPSAFPTSPQVGDRVEVPDVPTTLPTIGTQPDIGVIRGAQIGIDQEPLAVRQLTDDDIVGTGISAQGGLQFYNSIDGQFYRSTAEGVVPISDQVFFNVDNVTWSPTQNEAVIEYPDGSNIYFNFSTGEQTTIARHWEDFSFSGDGTQLVAKNIGLSPDSRWLVTADPTGKQVRLIEPLGTNDNKVIVDWSPNKQIVGMSKTGEAIGGDREEILFIGQNGENFRSMAVEGRGFESEWSPSGNKLLYSVHSGRTDFKPELWVVDAAPTTIGGNRKSLRINTWAHKCTFWGENNLVCGVPSSLQTGAGFAPDVSNTTPDRLVHIDTTTGVQTNIPLAANDHVVDSIFIDENTNRVYFTDKNKSGLFDISLSSL